MDGALAVVFVGGDLTGGWAIWISAVGVGCLVVGAEGGEESEWLWVGDSASGMRTESRGRSRGRRSGRSLNWARIGVEKFLNADSVLMRVTVSRHPIGGCKTCAVQRCCVDDAKRRVDCAVAVDGRVCAA